ncbi:hypothetical protein GCM10010252_77520 [Streptomyces aureoverticillatus]|nr:Lyd14 [Streptomyces sp.]GGS27109.1 hypothetical protein GCM10010252_77520 [Streptomyces aureoverticillatus]
MTRCVLGTASESSDLDDLAVEISRLVGHVLPHDGFCLMGMDPVAGAPAFAARRHGYSPYACFNLGIGHRADRDLNPFGELIRGPRRVCVFGTGSPKNDVTAPWHEVMAAEGVACELRVALTLRGRAWGGFVLVRGSGVRPFATEDADRAARLGPLLAAAVRSFVNRTGRLGPARGGPGPGTLIIDERYETGSATPDGRAWLRSLAADPLHTGGGDHAITPMWGPLVAARRGGRNATVCVPTAHGWITVSAQALDGPLDGHVAVTIQSAPVDHLLTAVSAWHGITPKEHLVIQHALEGMQVKQIARCLDLSHHTVNDYFRAIYRKVGVNSRDELITLLTR